MAVLNFVYSYPYESVLLELVGKKLSAGHDKEALTRRKQAQKIWDKYELKIFDSFEEIYKIKIPEKFIEAFISLAAPHSYSHPMTITLKGILDLERNEIHQRGLIYVVVHELAHYFLYTRSEKEYANKLWKRIKDKNLLGNHGVNLHFLIQAVEFGIIGEIFGKSYSKYARDWVIKNRKGEYRQSAKALFNYDVPLDKTCLESISKKILSWKEVAP